MQTSIAELTEALGLGASLARIEADGRHNAGLLNKIDATVTDMAGRMGKVEVTQGQQGEQLRTAFQRIEQLEHHDGNVASKTDVERLEREQAKLSAALDSTRLTWPKLIAGVAGIGGVATAGFALLLSYANSIGVFTR